MLVGSDVRVNGLTEFVNRLGLARVAAMAVVAALMLGFFAFLILRASSPQLAPLYTGLSLEDSAAIVSELQSQNIPYELRSEGETILVARDQITATRMALAENGLPQRGQVGYEIFDEQSALGTTSFVQNINNVRALEGELARTIASLARIKSARVHLVLPERELFRRERKDPTASIVLQVRGELTGGEIRAIQHLVASAIEGLTPPASPSSIRPAGCSPRVPATKPIRSSPPRSRSAPWASRTACAPASRSCSPMSSAPAAPACR